jgi:hypothetical protein
MSSIVYGYIHCFRSDAPTEAHNSKVLAEMVSSGAWLIRPMFSFLPYSRGHSYYGPLIHFAAYYKEFWCLFDDWIAEYEVLLEKLIWDTSEVIHVYTGERRSWGSSGTQKTISVRGMQIQSREVFLSYHNLPGMA